MIRPSNLLIKCFCIILFANTLSLAQRILKTKNKDNALITFGSCAWYYGYEPADILYRVAEMNSDVWIWLGDVAYVDEKTLPPYFTYAGKEKVIERFNDAKNKPEYKKLRETTPIIGVWDDHDYGLNNAGMDFEHKDVTQQLWLDFMDEPIDSARRKRKGVYESYYLISPKHVKVILLDVRYHQNPDTQDMLGIEQWEWLEKELRSSTAEYILIGSGTQILPDDRMVPEAWLEKSRVKLLQLIRKYKLSGVFLLSGDVHYAEIMKYPCKSRVGYTLYEFTSSGLTHDIGDTFPYFGVAYIETLYPDLYSTQKDRFLERNFGVLNITFGEKGSLKFEIRDYFGNVVQTREITKSEVTYDQSVVDLNATCEIDTPVRERFLNKFVESLLGLKSFIFVSAGTLFLVIFGIWKCIRGTFRICCRKSKVKSE